MAQNSESNKIKNILIRGGQKVDTTKYLTHRKIYKNNIESLNKVIIRRLNNVALNYKYGIDNTFKQKENINNNEKSVINSLVYKKIREIGLKFIKFIIFKRYENNYSRTKMTQSIIDDNYLNIIGYDNYIYNDETIQYVKYSKSAFKRLCIEIIQINNKNNLDTLKESDSEILKKLFIYHILNLLRVANDLKTLDNKKKLTYEFVEEAYKKLHPNLDTYLKNYYNSRANDINFNAFGCGYTHN